jgi:hypothetical protein
MSKVKLYAEQECWDFMESHPDEFASFGCGPGWLGDILVPDTMYFLNISMACKIHDWYYRFYPENTEEARQLADSVFKNNLLRIVRAKTSNRFLLWLRERRCRTYYSMVRFSGGPAFYDERNEDEVFKEVDTEKYRVIRID